MHVHAVLDSSIDRILDAWEQVHAELPLTELRFSLAHVDRIGPRNIARLRALGAGRGGRRPAGLQGRRLRRGVGGRGDPPGAAAGRPVGGRDPAGRRTDATRASSYSPWLSLYWLVAGRSLDGVARR